MVVVRFAALYRIGDGFTCGHLWLKRRYATGRVVRIEVLGKDDHLHHFEVTDRRPVDVELRRFIRRAYAIGQRRHIKAR